MEINSRFAAHNSNCPIDARIKWEKVYGDKLTPEEEMLESTLNADILEVF